jgi:flavin reductase (DIM6/NTAB) family NADH-FMN oxidoreductase RutF
MKDTLRHALPTGEGGTGEFVVNVAIESYVASIARAAESLAYGESEFPLSGLTPVASTQVRAPRVLESPIAYECRTLQVIRLADGVPGGGNIVIGQVLKAHVRDDLISDGCRVDPERLAAIGIMGGATYLRTSDYFDLPVSGT